MTSGEKLSGIWVCGHQKAFFAVGVCCSSSALIPLPIALVFRRTVITTYLQTCVRPRASPKSFPRQLICMRSHRPLPNNPNNRCHGQGICVLFTKVWAEAGALSTTVFCDATEGDAPGPHASESGQPISNRNMIMPEHCVPLLYFYAGRMKNRRRGVDVAARPHPPCFCLFGRVMIAFRRRVSTSFEKSGLSYAVS